MSWPDYALARKYLLEEFVGTPVRRAEREAKAIEDARANASRKALSQRR